MMGTFWGAAAVVPAPSDDMLLQQSYDNSIKLEQRIQALENHLPRATNKEAIERRILDLKQKPII